jgi:hypothetical protein
MKRAIGLHATTARARRKKRGFSSELAANAAGHIALRCPAPRKPGVYIHVHPLGGVKLCFTESTAEPMCPGRRSSAAVSCFGVVRSAMEN